MEVQNWNERFVQPTNQVFEQGKNYRGEMDAERTRINLGAFAGNYKLSEAYANIRNLEFRADKKLRAQTFKQFLELRPPAGFSVSRPRRPRFPADEGYFNSRQRHLYPHGDMLVLVDKAVYPQVAAGLDQYVLDVGRDGYWATIHVVEGGRPSDVRQYIRTRRPRPVGVLAVGAIAAPWYEIETDQFPCDLYYMDLNGSWVDSDADGLYNAHLGHVNPEIWFGRLWTPTAGGNDHQLLNDYFARNHAFRLGRLGHSHSALAYVDDDWSAFADCAIDSMFPPADIKVVNDPLATDADLYKAEINTQRSWAQLCAHSWVQGHALKVGSTNEYINMPYFRDTNPPNAHFYNLFCCGPGKFTIPDYLGGWYVFDKKGGGKNPGLVAVASAKSGSMLFFEDFYGPLGKGKVIGDAYVDWWKLRGPTHDDFERHWFYGLVLLGDPTLSWWKGDVPQQLTPQPDDVFDHWPRKMELRWDPVNVPGATYSVEIDAFGAVKAGKWAEEEGRTFAIFHDITGNTLDHTFVGAQRGRWRVRAKIDGRECKWSPWSYFEFTI